MEQQTGSKRERSMSRLYIVTLFIQFIYRLHHLESSLDESQAGMNTLGRNMNDFRYADDI